MRPLQIALILALCSRVQSQPPSPAPAKGRQVEQPGPTARQPVTSNNEQAKPGVTVINQLYPGSDSRDKTKSEDLLTFFTFLLFAATAALCYVAWLQRKTMVEHKRSLEAMAAHLERGLTETKKAADAAGLNAQAVINSERPWLVISVEGQEARRFAFRAKNVGRTPARLVSIHGDVVPVENGRPLPENPEYGAPRSLSLHPRLLAPDAIGRILYECFTNTLPDGVNAGVSNGSVRLFIVGKVVYENVVLPEDLAQGPESKPAHETRWCYMLTGLDHPALPGFSPPAYEEYT